MEKLQLISLMAGFLLVGLVANTGGAREKLMLRDSWQIQSSTVIEDNAEKISEAGFDTSGWYPATVPVTVLAALVGNGVYPDPYYGLNLKEKIPGYMEYNSWPGLLSIVEAKALHMPRNSPFYPNWWYRTEFTLPGDYRGRNLTLHLEGINFKANIWLNGRLVADSNEVRGMFRRWEFPVNDYVSVGGKNCLAVEIISPGKIPARPYFSKQKEATTGWDDHNPLPSDLNMGVWQDVYITATGPVKLRHPYVSTDLDLPSLDKAHLTVSAYAVNMTDKEVAGELRGKIEEMEFSQAVKLAPGEKKLVEFSPDRFEQLNMSNPRVWWPNPVGPQELYHLDLEFRVDGSLSDSDRVRFGIREVNTYMNDEGWRQYEVNGRKILIRGGAWMTTDMLLRLSGKRYDGLVRYAREANLNMLRSEGFSIRETDEFYDICDEYGVMVTQQIFGRSIPDEDLAIACVEDMMLRIRNHPSLVHFLGHDETNPTENLDAAYRDLIARYTPERTYQPHSGAFNPEKRRETGGTRTGTLELWQYAGPGHYYTHKEDGAWGFAQSGGIGGVVARAESIRRMMPEDQWWPPGNQTWSFHTVTQGWSYYSSLLRAINTRYGEPKDLDDFSMTAHVLNYECARGMYEAYGRNKYSSTGITTWKYDAAWPAAITWQYVDWYLLATGAYHGAKKACEALHVQYSYDDDSICVVNAFYREYKDLEVSAKVYNMDMTEKYAREEKVNVGPDSVVRAFTLDWPDGLSKSHFLKLELKDSSGNRVSDNFYWLSTQMDEPTKKFYGIIPLKSAALADHTDLRKLPKVRLDVKTIIEKAGKEKVVNVTVKNPTDSLAFFIDLAVIKGKGGPEVGPTFWSENHFSLLPGEQKKVKAVLYTEDLEGAEPVIKVGGWNIERAESMPR